VGVDISTLAPICHDINQTVVCHPTSSA
jgi:hypothetical protein